MAFCAVVRWRRSGAAVLSFAGGKRTASQIQGLPGSTGVVPHDRPQTVVPVLTYYVLAALHWRSFGALRVLAVLSRGCPRMGQSVARAVVHGGPVCADIFCHR